MKATRPAARLGPDLRQLAIDLTLDGARSAFQEIVRRLVKLKHPSARSVDDRVGDWGIDTFVGELDTGAIAVWQAKYFIDGLGDSQQSQIRASLKQVLKKAADAGIALSAWTLVIACRPSADELRWWDGYKRRQEKAHNLKITLWGSDEVGDLLRSPDASDIRAEFFGRPAVVPRRLEDVPDLSVYDSALFVAQLRAAHVLELDAAKAAFFNAEALSREVAAKGIDHELRELRELSFEVHQLWEMHFNAAFGGCKDEVVPALYPAVLREITDRPWAHAYLPAGLVHRLGSIHQHVEQARAGWVRSWREIAGNRDV